MNQQKQSILVVGAGFAGAVAAREIAEAGWDVTVIDKRSHIAGNCYDFVDDTGVRVHRYGPHLFHTNDMRVVEWLSRFTDWLPYEHRVSVLLPNNQTAPLPINRHTIAAVTGVDIRDEAEALAILTKIRVPKPSPANAEEYLISQIGSEMTELLFGRYTRKMWGTPLSDVDASVVKRIAIRLDEEDRYFPNDSFQALPEDGYTATFHRILEHERIKVILNNPFDHSMLSKFVHSFLSMPIDEFFDHQFGHLPYRSIRFHTASCNPAELSARTATVNFSDESPYTRTTYWHMLPGHWMTRGPRVSYTVEEPCSYIDNNLERYYPVKTADGRYQQMYGQYSRLAKANTSFTFIGRCGTYQYLDMHQVINQTLVTTRRWLKANPRDSSDAV